MDASFLIRVPNICPDTPSLNYTPVLLYTRDSFTKPAPFMPDVAVAIDDAVEDKAKMLHFHTSQFYEWLPYLDGYEAEVPADEASRLAWTTRRVEERDANTANRYRALLTARYGDGAGGKIIHAEFFEVSEYGRPLPPGEIDRWFPR